MKLKLAGMPIFISNLETTFKTAIKIALRITVTGTVDCISHCK